MNVAFDGMLDVPVGYQADIWMNGPGLRREVWGHW